jgi:hypothetical protein
MSRLDGWNDDEVAATRSKQIANLMAGMMMELLPQ